MHRDLIFLHWMMVLLFAVAVSAVITRELLPAGHVARPMMRTGHMAAGQLILVLGLLRLLVRLRHPPPTRDGGSASLRWLSGGVLVLFYGVMLAQPLTGLMFLQAGDKTVKFLGLALPRVMPSDPQLHFDLKDAHAYIGKAFYVLFALHLVAALWHHFFLQDGSLRAMLRLRSGAAAPGAAAAPAASARPASLDTPALRRQMVDLVDAGRSPAQLAAEHGCSAGDIATWVAQAAAAKGAAMSPTEADPGPRVH
jgi:cytochrome b561